MLPLSPALVGGLRISVGSLSETVSMKSQGNVLTVLLVDLLQLASVYITCRHVFRHLWTIDFRIPIIYKNSSNMYIRTHL